LRSESVASSARSRPKSWFSRINRSRALPGMTCESTSCSCMLGQRPSCAALAAVPEHRAHRARPAMTIATRGACASPRTRDETADRSIGSPPTPEKWLKPRSRRWTASFDAIYLDVSSALLPAVQPAAQPRIAVRRPEPDAGAGEPGALLSRLIDRLAAGLPRPEVRTQCSEDMDGCQPLRCTWRSWSITHTQRIVGVG